MLPVPPRGIWHQQGQLQLEVQCSLTQTELGKHPASPLTSLKNIENVSESIQLWTPLRWAVTYRDTRREHFSWLTCEICAYLCEEELPQFTEPVTKWIITVSQGGWSVDALFQKVACCPHVWFTLWSRRAQRRWPQHPCYRASPLILMNCYMLPFQQKWDKLTFACAVILRKRQPTCKALKWAFRVAGWVPSFLCFKYPKQTINRDPWKTENQLSVPGPLRKVMLRCGYFSLTPKESLLCWGKNDCLWFQSCS